MTISNKEIARHFHLLGKLSDLHGENPFKGKSYANAAFRIERLERPLASLLPDDIAKLDGIGPAIQEKISLLLDGKPIPALMKLLEATPAGVLDIMEIKGLGPKKVRTIWKDMGIESVGELYYACHENRLAHAKGFGEKTQSAVLNSIEFMQASQGKFHYASLESMATQLVEQMSALSSVKRASLTGAIRRCCEILEEISLLVIAPDPHQLIVELGSLMMVNATENPILAEKNGVPIHIYVASEAHWYRDLFLTTGPAAHADRFQPAETLESERVVYEAAGAPYFIPEIRDLNPEVPPAETDVLSEKDLKGILHVHTTYSDGLHTLTEMATRCRDMGYEYIGISDHSQSAFYANGLKPDRIRQQHEEIDRLNEQLAPFKIFKGIESDILNDGSLDYDDHVLSSFDFIVASVHSQLQMDKEKATRRLLTAICNPHTTILGHMTGRLLLSRAGYPVDHETIIRACAEHNVVIELNAHPYRLDIDWRWIPACMEAGVMISVNPDAHAMDGLKDVHFGSLAARKGGLLRAATFNTLDAETVARHFAGKNQTAGKA
ncbi:MAG: PHP domain-containing protein [Flavobacteriales bacterium]|nr:PHP domain-containing protein [Flavobacteriales bacterium]MCB9448447.1 PHP domain-containing protein [Flavobacteriales bacterium]